VSGQGVIGRDCAWCGPPETTEVEVQPAQYRMVSRCDPMTGKRTVQQQFARAAVVVAVCDAHEQITRDQPAPVLILRQRTARGVQQLDIFATGGGETSR
jgi:hypothetical protein